MFLVGGSVGALSVFFYVSGTDTNELLQFINILVENKRTGLMDGEAGMCL